MASKNIRIGNDIGISWSLYDDEGHPYDLTGRDVAVELIAGPRKIRITEIETEGNALRFVYYGKDQKYAGSYDLKYIENDGKEDMVTFDTRDAFTIVNHSWQAVDKGETPETIQLEFVTVSSNIHSAVGPRGVGIESIEQIEISTEDEGVNVIRQTLTDGRTADFEVRNGSKGSKGDPAIVNGKSGAVINLTAEDLGALPDTTHIPSKTSELTNDSNFITNLVNNLANYYLKSETYTKAEVAALIGAIQQFHYEIYATLPASGENNVLYLIGPAGSGSDKYEEYVYANNTWVKIGDTTIDLSNYPTTVYLDSALRLEADGRMLSDRQLSDRITNIETVVPSTATSSNSLTTVNWVNTRLNRKQDTLVSGDNIKTINGQTLLGRGNITVTQVVHLNSFWNISEEDDYEILIYDHGDVTGAGLKAILDAGNIPQLNVYVNEAGEGEEPQWVQLGEAFYGCGCLKDEDGNIIISEFRLNNQFFYDLSLLFLFEGESVDAYGYPFFQLLGDFVSNMIEGAIPSVSEINELFNE